MKFIRKPDIVDAVQWQPGDRHPAVQLLPGETAVGWLSTSKGGATVMPGDWILQDAAGDYTVKKPHAFEALYEEMLDDNVR